MADGDVPLPAPTPGRSIPRIQIPYPDFMVAPDDDSPTHATYFRLRGWHAEEGEVVIRQFSSEVRANDAAAQYVALGWGGDATVVDLSGPTVLAEYPAPLTAPDAPI
jgi:hypothetical protein